MFLLTEFFDEVQILLPNYIWIIPNCQWKKMSWHTLREILGSPLEKKLHSPSTLALIKKKVHPHSVGAEEEDATVNHVRCIKKIETLRTG